MDKLTSVVSVVSNSGVGSALGEAGVIEARDSESLCPSLSWKHRLIGCGCCVGLGMLFSLLSFIAILQLDLVLFSVLFSFGNVVAIAGLLFLAGPMAQLRRMFDEKRWIATTVYLVFIVLTLVCALALHNALLVLVCCLVQIGAMVWYVLSYIPFARDAVKSCFGRLTR
ncbi:putative vesicle transport protein SFT2B-like [Trypanosoma conorhini]|uniref:Vesicle transport protein n=1 Tax=Trypanosoma conorhini TaxID=83891 RepID=A0A3R7KVR2_9TRYP|nr:putative vesicle transport protein SFT2B-like [Trypanosoma conorhini]RNF16132.1 putative vesicle transport protein SFT2B-like [Trypanosoma conorhini]